MTELLAKFLPEWFGGFIIGAALLFLSIWLATPELVQRAFDLHIASRCELGLKSDASEKNLILNIDPMQPCTCAINRERNNNLAHTIYVFTFGYVKPNPVGNQNGGNTPHLATDRPNGFRTPEFSFVNFLGERTEKVLYSGACGDVAGYFLDPVEEARKQQRAALMERAARQAAEAERLRLRLQSEALKATEPLMEIFGQMFQEYGR